MLLLSGSPATDSVNSRFLLALGRLYGDNCGLADYLAHLPVFQPQLDHSAWPLEVVRLREEVAAAPAVVISTPAYLHNLPAVLKNTLEWLTSSGELHEKPVLVFTLTPHEPRGERARQSLLWSLEALNARVVAETGLYHDDLALTPAGEIGNAETVEALRELLALLP